MSSIVDNPKFSADYDRLKAISLNPSRHAASNAYEHCEMVHQRAIELAVLNRCTEEEIALLSRLARVHDIGKIAGTANPVESVALLPNYGIKDERLVNMVKYHDMNLPWYQAAQRGEPPSERAWNKLARKVDTRLLCLFMVADRVDCPGGWRTNHALVWFLEEVERRKLFSAELVLDDGPAVPSRPAGMVEVSAGGVLIQRFEGESRALVIRARKEGFEVPKGHIEPQETKEAAALRELREETGLVSSVVTGAEAGVVEYSFEQYGVPVTKRVHYFAAFVPTGEIIRFDMLPSRTKELRWVTSNELDVLPLVNEQLRSVIARALEMAAEC